MKQLHIKFLKNLWYKVVMKKLTESLEKYLLAVYELSKDNQAVMVKDVASYLKIGGASTAEAIRTLTERGFLDYVPYGDIKLTDKGIVAVDIKIYRHETISNFLNKVLNIETEQAEKNASAIEYSMTEDVLKKFVHFISFMEQCSCKEPKWIKSCKHSLESGKISEKCTTCISSGSGCGNCCGK